MSIRRDVVGSQTTNDKAYGNASHWHIGATVGHERMSGDVGGLIAGETAPWLPPRGALPVVPAGSAAIDGATLPEIESSAGVGSARADRVNANSARPQICSKSVGSQNARLGGAM